MQRESFHRIKNRIKELGRKGGINLEDLRKSAVFYYYEGLPLEIAAKRVGVSAETLERWIREGEEQCS